MKIKFEIIATGDPNAISAYLSGFISASTDLLLASAVVSKSEEVLRNLAEVPMELHNADVDMIATFKILSE